jgi:hypothetical protein
MNHEETVRLLTTIRSSYDIKFFDEQAFEMQAKMWQRALVDVPLNEAATIFEIWVNTEERPPTLAAFKKLLAKNKNPELFQSAETAWETVDYAVRKYGWNNELKALETFSEPTKRAVRNIGGWQKICQTPLGNEWNFLRKDFINVYEDFSQNQKEEKLLPTQILRKIQQIQQNEQKRLNE